MAARTIHPFPARMAPEIALDCIPEAKDGKIKKILDPMCGSGTVVAVAVGRGHDATGVDLDPLAILMTRVATTPIDTACCKQLCEEVVDMAAADSSTMLPWTDSETPKFAEYWFADKQRLQLARLSRAIDAISDCQLRAVAQIALSRIIITKAPKASLAADTSHSRPHRVTDGSRYDVFVGFSHSMDNLVRLLDARDLVGTASAYRDDCRTLKSVDTSSIDMVITSPPYLNAIDYMRGHKFALIWLGYSIPELRRIRSVSIGAERRLDGPAESVANDFVTQLQRSATNPDQFPTAMLTRYAHDLLHFAKQMRRVMRPAGHLIAVVGNSTLRDNFVQNDKIFEQALHHNGFTTSNIVERPLPENSRYLPIASTNGASSITRRMRTETVLYMTAS